MPASLAKKPRVLQKGVGRIVAPISQHTKNGRRTAAPERFRKDAAQVFADSSPRWGKRGEAPVRGKTVPFPKADVSKKTKVIAGTTGAGVLVDNNPHQVFYKEVNSQTQGWKTRRSRYGQKGHK